MASFLRKYPIPLLCIFVLLVFLISNGLEVIKKPPASVHQWRQSDCAAYARTYYEKNSGLFQPSTYNLAGTDGRVISEFPIIYYVGAKLCHITGFHYWMFRGLTFFCYLIGLIFLYKCARFWIKDPLLALLPSAILATSPYYYYYAVNFLPNVPAIALSFVGLYYLLAYMRSGKWLHITASTLLFILTTALKPTDGGILWLAYEGSLILLAISKKDSIDRKRLMVTIVCSALIAICIFAWYKYDTWYNDEYHNHQNLLGIYPIWDLSWPDIKYIFKDRMMKLWLSSYHDIYILHAALLLFILYVINWRSLNRLLRTITLLSLLGTLVYSILWYHAFSDHDYYQLIFVVSPVLLSITILEYYERSILPLSSKKTRKYVNAVFLILVVAGVIHNHDNQEWRYTFPDFNSYNWHMYELEPYLEQHGIKKSDIVVCAPDKSPNISLTAIGHQGYTEEFNDNNYNINVFKAQGARYLILTDSSYLHNPLYEPYMKNFMFSYDGINVYDMGAN